MSGGFFRGTSADQDTRFSNKQAKLLKTQKFAPELDHLVDMTKVKMDVIRPWIATRATELLGFEDEVLINFVYGLLDGKDVDGKQIQIQLTGFMEKNTGKFMKELWGLLLSAQNNASGVPQQFLDAKAEETKKRKAETDRITQEIQRRKEKEGRELEQEKQKRMDGEVDKARFAYATNDSVSKRASSVHPEEETEEDVRQGPRARSRRSISPHSDDRSPIHWQKHSPSRSVSKSSSKCRSYSKEGRKSRSISVSPQSQRHLLSPRRQDRSPLQRSISPERRHRSPRRSISPRRRHSPRNARSPSRRRSPYGGRRSASPSRRRSPSPFPRRSPHARRRSPSYVRRRSPSPLSRRSPPSRRRSPPSRYRSPSPLRRRSPPLRRRSPVQFRRRTPPLPYRRSPAQYRSLSPARHRSPPVRRRSPPHRSPERRRKSPPRSPRSHAADSQMSLRQRKRSRSPYRSRSPSYSGRGSLSRETDNRTNGVDSKRYRDEYASRRTNERRSPVRHAMDRVATERPDSRHEVPDSTSHRLAISSRSPHYGSRDQHDSRSRRHDVPSDESPNQSKSPIRLAKVNQKENSHSESPSRLTSRVARHDSPEASRGEETSQASDEDLPERHVHRLSLSSEGIEYGPGGIRGHSMDGDRDRLLSAKKLARDESSSEERVNAEQVMKTHGDDYVVSEKHPPSIRDEYKESRFEAESVKKSKGREDQSRPLDSFDSDSEETDVYKHRDSEKRKHKKSDKHKRVLDHSSDSDSQIDEKKEAKRRRKDEKRLRKEERRRRREERHRRRLERRSTKLKVKSIDTVTPPSDLERNHNDESDSDGSIRKGSKLGDAEERESEQKKLEIELRQKALESLKAKKAINH